MTMFLHIFLSTLRAVVAIVGRAITKERAKHNKMTQRKLFGATTFANAKF